MISFVCWKWAVPGSGRTFLSEHVNVLRAMIARNCRLPHRLICITDDPRGLSSEILVLPVPWRGFDHLLSPEDGRIQKPRRPSPLRKDLAPLPPTARLPFPSCYRRLWNFSEEARVLGDRIIALDIDVVIVRDFTELCEVDADFVGWCDPRFGWRKVAGGIYMLKTGSHPEVWDDFDPVASPCLARAAGNGGSDQAWMSYKLFPPGRQWSSADGVVKLGWLEKGAPAPPPGVRLAFTSGHSPPWDPKTQRTYPWIRNHWTLSR